MNSVVRARVAHTITVASVKSIDESADILEMLCQYISRSDSRNLAFGVTSWSLWKPRLLRDFHELSSVLLACGKENMGHFMILK